jgi:hypothetical protein
MAEIKVQRPEQAAPVQPWYHSRAIARSGLTPMTDPDDLKVQPGPDDVAPGPQPTPAPAPPREAPSRYDANLRLIRYRLADEHRKKPKRRWKLL